MSPNEYPAWSRDLDSPEWQAIFADPRWTDLVRDLEALRAKRAAESAARDDETAA
jgi:hypothetical protein